MGPIVLAAQLQNPFGFDRLDLDIALFGMRLHKETCCIANAGQVKNVGYNSKMTFLNLHKVRDLRPKADGTVEVEEKKSEKENALNGREAKIWTKKKRKLREAIAAEKKNNKRHNILRFL